MRSSHSRPNIFSSILILFSFLFGVFGNFLVLIVPVSPLYAYTESDSDTYAAYQKKIEWALQDAERDFRVNGAITDNAISTIRSLVNEAYIRLPDTPDEASKNDAIKKSVDLYLDLAAKNKSSQTNVSNALREVWRFITESQISQITGSITATPAEGNAPLTTSFMADAKDPSWVNISDANYIWWTRENGGYRRELGRWPTLTYTFAKEGNYQVFLDVVSGSRNKKGKMDVLPFSKSQDISVKPRLWNIVLLINGVNVSNIDSLKINPVLWKIGVIFDATASRAVSNGTIQKTKWDFWNGNTLEYDGAPVIERQLFVNQDKYPITLEVTTNQGQSFKKTIQLLVRDPAAVITIDKEVGYIGEDMTMSARSYLANSTSVEYSWQVKGAGWGDAPLASKVGSTFSYKFQKVGQYIVSLQAKSPNGSIDQDSRIITIESHEPLVNLDSPKAISTEKPSTILFDASRSTDPDTSNAKNLSYTWTIDGEKVLLDNQTKDGAVGTYTFTEKWSHTVSLTVANAYGKVKTTDKTFDIASTLTVAMNITPRAAPIGTTVNFQARSPQARFFEWNLGDGSPAINGTTDNIAHIYKKTGIYSATLTVKNIDGTASNTIERKIYVTDAKNPFALIDIKNSGGSAFEDSSACDWVGAFLVNRAESTTIDGGNSINTDGSTSGLSYTWKYLDRVKTGPSLSEKFTELGCFPIELTVKSDANGSTHTSKRYIQIKNIAPKITSVDALVDTTKKDSQKLIVKVTANGARDEDGVITSYIWYYKTESDTEPQNVKITQSPSTAFVLPNVSEKYTFSVILEDNDGARVNSADIIRDQSPLIITNDDGNINLPLITLIIPKTQILTGEPIEFSASAKNILGTDITSKSEYFWDFDGDGKIDQKTTEPRATYTYRSSGKYNMKLKVVSNGSSNTKYQLIQVKNELKASALAYKKGDYTYFLNTSQGTYDMVHWKIGDRDSESLYSIVVPTESITSNPILTVNAWSNESASFEILPNMVQDLSRSTQSGISIQTYPQIDADTITLKSPTDTLILSAFGNDGTQYSIDTDTKIDSDLDGIGDNDSDNKDTPSYTDGSAFVMTRLGESKIRTRQMKISVIKNGAVLWARTVSVVLDYIADTSGIQANDLSGSGNLGLSTVDRGNLEKLQAKIRNLTSDDRIILTQYYNSLIENWDDLHDRTEGLLQIQTTVNESTTIADGIKKEFSDILDIILVGDAASTNEISVASRVIEWLIQIDDPDHDYTIERLEKIKAHPANLTENKILGQEILEKIKTNSKLSNGDKLLIRSQMLVIVNGGQESVSAEATNALVVEAPIWSGILGFVWGVVKIFLIILALICGLFLIGYIIYRFSKKSGDMGFQDFLIDSIAHSKQPKNSDPLSVKTPQEPPTIIVTPAKESVSLPTLVMPVIDPLRDHTEAIVVPVANTETLVTDSRTDTTEEVIPLKDENGAEAHVIPDWLKPVATDTIDEEVTPTPVDPLDRETLQEEWLSGDPLLIENSPEAALILPSEKIPETEAYTPPEVLSETPPLHDDTLIPEWLRAPGTSDSLETTTEGEDLPDLVSPPLKDEPPVASTELPDWLRDSVDGNTKGIPEQEQPKIPRKKKSPGKIEKKSTPKKEKSESTLSPPADTSGKTDDIPDWLK